MAGGYKCWRSRTDAELHVICGDGSEAFEALPVRIRNLGPWAGGKEGEIQHLRLPYRILLAEQGFVVIHAHVSKLTLEAHQVKAAENRTCPHCDGSGHVPMHGGLRQKDCPRCRGGGWVPKRAELEASKRGHHLDR
jgi:hypothetical protein